VKAIASTRRTSGERLGAKVGGGVDEDAASRGGEANADEARPSPRSIRIDGRVR
jgi:hypothetical protein